MVQSSTKKIIVNYCLMRDCLMVSFSEFLPLKGSKGKEIEKRLRKLLIDKGIPLYSWIPIIFSPVLPKIEGSITIEIDLAPKWRILKQRLLSELNK